MSAAVRPIRLCSVTRKRFGRPRYQPTPEKKFPLWKTEVREKVTTMLETHSKIFVIAPNVLKFHEEEDLRYQLKHHNMTIKQYHKGVTRAVVQLTRYGNISHMMNNKGRIIWAFTNEKEIDMKAILKIFRTHKADLLGAIVDDTLMHPEDMVTYTTLPSLHAQRTELVNILSQPSKTLAQLLQTNQTNLSHALTAYVEQGGTLQTT